MHSRPAKNFFRGTRKLSRGMIFLSRGIEIPSRGTGIPSLGTGIPSRTGLLTFPWSVDSSILSYMIVQFLFLADLADLADLAECIFLYCTAACHAGFPYVDVLLDLSKLHHQVHDSLFFYCFYIVRMQWLRKGSRELFGTIIEDQVSMYTVHCHYVPFKMPFCD
jgi:hypothetical protein